MYIVSVFYDENLDYKGIEDVVEDSQISHNKMIDSVDVNEYTKYINELNEELDGNLIYSISKVSNRR